MIFSYQCHVNRNPGPSRRLLGLYIFDNLLSSGFRALDTAAEGDTILIVARKMEIGVAVGELLKGLVQGLLAVKGILRYSFFPEGRMPKGYGSIIVYKA